MIKFEARGGGIVYLAPEAIAALEEVHMGDRGLSTVIRTFDGRRYETGSWADDIAKAVDLALARRTPPASAT